MRRIDDVFFETPCLTERSPLIDGITLQKKWFKSADKRYIGQVLQKFIDYNMENFHFLGISPYLVGIDQNTALGFRTTQYIGSIPLRAPDTGKQIGDFVVTPKFTGSHRYQEYIEILNLIGDDINPETKHSLTLVSGRNFRPPLYLEAVKFIQTLDELVKKQWRKFSFIEKVSFDPRGKVNWNKYISREYKTENKLKFPSNRNILSEFHDEYSQIRYVFDICRKELQSPNTPLNTKIRVKPKIDYLEQKLYLHIPVKTNSITVKHADSPTVKITKNIANRILNFDLRDSIAWRVNYSDVFEKFVQYIFQRVATEHGGKLIPNYKFKSKSKRLGTWQLKHLEPDALFHKDNLLVCIDSKYKSHLYNKYEESEILKEDHRHDLHQIMAYNSFIKGRVKVGILCYPSYRVEINDIEYVNRINQVVNKIKILGLPPKIQIINEAKKLLFDEFAKMKNFSTN